MPFYFRVIATHYGLETYHPPKESYYWHKSFLVIRIISFQFLRQSCYNFNLLVLLKLSLTVLSWLSCSQFSSGMRIGRREEKNRHGFFFSLANVLLGLVDCYHLHTWISLTWTHVDTGGSQQTLLSRFSNQSSWGIA